MFPILQTQNSSIDIRDMSNATWKDIVASVLETCNFEASLSVLYEKIAPYKKAKESKFWKEKVRQTLQVYTNYFHSPTRGVWQLRRTA